MQQVLLAGICLIAMLPGCLDAATDPTAPEPRPPEPFSDDEIGAAIDWWEAFARQEFKRDSLTPGNDAIRAHLVAELDAAGFDVEVRSYEVGRAGVTLPQETPAKYHAIVATKNGTGHPLHRIGLVSHYDTQTATFEGAYDDASGVAAEFALCQRLAATAWNKTLTCIFFDAEEQGLVASQQYVQDVVIEGDEPYVYDFVIGYDMTGINWPGHDWKMYLMSGGDEHVPHLGDLGRRVLHEDLGYPESGVEVLDTHDRNSDERNFREAGIPIFRFAGGRNAGDYPEYHRPGDTVEYVYDFVDGRPNFEAGMRTILDGSVRLYWELDRVDPAFFATATSS